MTSPRAFLRHPEIPELREWARRLQPVYWKIRVHRLRETPRAPYGHVYEDVLRPYRICSRSARVAPLIVVTQILAFEDYGRVGPTTRAFACMDAFRDFCVAAIEKETERSHVPF